MSQWPSTWPDYGTEPAIYSVYSCPWPQTRGENPGYVCSPWGQDDAHSQQDAEQGNTRICWIFLFPYSHLVYVHSAFYGCTEQITLLSIHPSVSPSIHPSIYLSVCLRSENKTGANTSLYKELLIIPSWSLRWHSN